MLLNEFLNFNVRCPVCDRDLTLYMQWDDSVCFKAKKVKRNIFNFTPYKCISSDFGSTNSFLENNYVELYDYRTGYETKFGNSKIAAEAKKKSLYFFFLCNEEGFIDVNSKDYEIDIAKGCYYRTSALMEFQKNTKKDWSLNFVDKDQSELINQDEIFSFTKTNEDNSKFYILDFDYVNKITKFMHYSVTAEQEKNAEFEPKIFEKDMPLFNTRPNFSIDNRERLISRFDSWITLS